jgi:hypothetical protein
MKYPGKLALIAIALSCFVYVSCRDQNDTNYLHKKSENAHDLKKETGDEFASALAKVLQEKSVRELIKKEALSKYDGDYDVLYALVKNKEVRPGVTLESLLAIHSSSAAEWLAKRPLLTIFVPKLNGFGPESWNTDSQIPHVAVDNSHLGKFATFKTYAANGQQYELDAVKAPNFPVIVVKENERMIAKSKGANGGRMMENFLEKMSKKTVFEDTNFQYSFIGDKNPKDDEKKNGRLASYNELPVLLTWRFGTQVDPMEGQRDWIYYYIFPQIGYNQGTMSASYVEKVTGFKLSSPLVLQAMTDSWTEGALEFHVILAFVDRNGTIKTDLRPFFCAPSSLMDGNGNMLEYNPDIELTAWDMNRYGDEWKFSLLEHDPGGSYDKTISASSTFGYNFETNSGAGGLFAKIGLKFGTTGTFQKSSSEKITISAESDQLGDARWLYDTPIILSYGQVNGNWRYTTNSVGTGAAFLSIEPVAKWPDTRPIPD